MALITIVKLNICDVPDVLELIHASVTVANAGPDVRVLELLDRTNAAVCFKHLLDAPLGTDDVEDYVGEACEVCSLLAMASKQECEHCSCRASSPNPKCCSSSCLNNGFHEHQCLL